jgi:hypothetical protein
MADPPQDIAMADETPQFAMSDSLLPEEDIATTSEPLPNPLPSPLEEEFEHPDRMELVERFIELIGSPLGSSTTHAALWLMDVNSLRSLDRADFSEMPLAKLTELEDAACPAHICIASSFSDGKMGMMMTRLPRISVLRRGSEGSGKAF